MMLSQGFAVGPAEKRVIQDVATHYFCSTALGKKPRDFGFFKIRKSEPGTFEITFKSKKYLISFE